MNKMQHCRLRRGSACVCVCVLGCVPACVFVRCGPWGGVCVCRLCGLGRMGDAIARQKTLPTRPRQRSRAEPAQHRLPSPCSCPARTARNDDELRVASKASCLAQTCTDRSSEGTRSGIIGTAERGYTLGAIWLTRRWRVQESSSMTAKERNEDAQTSRRENEQREVIVAARRMQRIDRLSVGPPAAE